MKPQTKAFILSGGQGLRLRPLTEDRPKPLVAVNGRPIAEWQIRWLTDNVDLDEVVFMCGYRWERLKEHFGAEFRGVDVSYSVEDTPLGTGGAIKKAFASTTLGDDEDVIIANGDIITNAALGELLKTHTSAKPSPTVTILLVPYKSRFGTVSMDSGNHVKQFLEKPEFPGVWINGGIYVARARKLARDLPAKGDIERATFPKLAARSRVMAYPFRGFWSLIDSIKDLQEVEAELKSRRGDLSAR